MSGIYFVFCHGFDWVFFKSRFQHVFTKRGKGGGGEELRETLPHNKTDHFSLTNFANCNCMKLAAFINRQASLDCGILEARLKGFKSCDDCTKRGTQEH